MQYDPRKEKCGFRRPKNVARRTAIYDMGDDAISDHEEEDEADEFDAAKSGAAVVENPSDSNLTCLILKELPVLSKFETAYPSIRITHIVMEHAVFFTYWLSMR